MKLFEAIVDANHRALAGDHSAGLHPSDFPDGLPLVALTCIDPRLNRLLPEVLGIREEDFIWLRNAGNIIFDPVSGMMRTLALACAIKGGREIAIMGHTDCRVRQVSVTQLVDSFRALGINRSRLPDDLVEFFGLFASEQQNVIKGVDHVRRSPLISPRIPVHGLMVDIESGRLDWLVNGYDQLGLATVASAAPSTPLGHTIDQVKAAAHAVAGFHSGEFRLPAVKIGDFTLDPQKWLSEVEVIQQTVHNAVGHVAPVPGPATPPVISAESHSPAIPIPPPISIFKGFGKTRK